MAAVQASTSPPAVVCWLAVVAALLAEAPGAPGAAGLALGTVPEQADEDYFYDDDLVYASSDEDQEPATLSAEEDDGDKVPDGPLGPRRGRHIPRRPEAADKTPWGANPPPIVFHSQDLASCPPLTQLAGLAARCSATRCASDADCRTAQRRCCHNGCVPTCLLTVDPPLLVDWEEETPDALHRAAPAAAAPAPAPAAAPQQLHSHGAPEVVALFGGCLLTPVEHRRLEDFRKGGHVRKCFCSAGAVVCQVNTR